MLKKYPDITNDTLFAYIIILLQHLPEKCQKKDCVRQIEFVINKYIGFVDLQLIGFPPEYNTFLKKLTK